MRYERWLAVLLLFFSSVLWASEFYEQGLKDFREGRNPEAVDNLKKALEQEPSLDGACLYLGILYQNIGNRAQAEAFFVRGRNIQGLQYKDISFNLANLYVNQERYSEAEEIYKELILNPGDHRTRSLLNLANVYVNKAVYPEARDLYLEYLMEDPESPQKMQIEKMVTLLQQAIDKVERERQREEEAARQKVLEEARQKALIDEIMKGLSSSGKETRNFSAESETLEEEFGESGLDD